MKSLVFSSRVAKIPRKKGAALRHALVKNGGNSQSVCFFYLSRREREQTVFLYAIVCVRTLVSAGVIIFDIHLFTAGQWVGEA